MSNYMLYNFHDTPADLFERMRLNVTLNEELGVRIWSFPMRYQPTGCRTVACRREMDPLSAPLDADHPAGDPRRGQRRSVLLQTRLWRHSEEFADLLMRPHHFIFNRDWYENQGGSAQFANTRRSSTN